MKRSHVLFLALTLLLSACGSASPKAPSSGGSTVMVTTYYDPDHKSFPKEAGPVLIDAGGQPTAIKQGKWIAWYPPAEGNTKRYERTYVADRWENGQYWREWNADTSLRCDWQDR